MLLGIEYNYEMHPIDKNETICFVHLGVFSILNKVVLGMSSFTLVGASPKVILER